MKSKSDQISSSRENQMPAIILAGGFGTRLRSVVSDIPKVMAPINDKPFLEYIFNFLKKNNISEVLLAVGYKYEVIRDYFGDSYGNIKIKYIIENKPLGTGGAIRQALTETNNNEVFVINGDTFFDIDLSVLEKAYFQHNSNLILSLKTMFDFDRYGSVEIDSGNKVLGFKEKTFKKTGNINGGIYLINKKIFDSYSLPEVFSFEEFMMDHHIQLSAYAQVFDNYFIDIGIPEDYQTAQKDLDKIIPVSI